MCVFVHITLYIRNIDNIHRMAFCIYERILARLPFASARTISQHEHTQVSMTNGIIAEPIKKGYWLKANICICIYIYSDARTNRYLCVVFLIKLLRGTPASFRLKGVQI